jgi:hypothetical protein
MAYKRSSFIHRNGASETENMYSVLYRESQSKSLITSSRQELRFVTFIPCFLSILWSSFEAVYERRLFTVFKKSHVVETYSRYRWVSCSVYLLRPQEMFSLVKYLLY